MEPDGLKIVSGGQTGADRSALDFAIAHGVPHGGWCPKRRRSEDGTIPDQYQLQETPSGNYLQRTEWNVRDSDGTVISSLAERLSGASWKTLEFAVKHRKPHLHLTAYSKANAASELKKWMGQHNIHVLNVAGPRASKEPEVAGFVTTILDQVFKLDHVG
jgi:hypothetical protein